MGVLLPSITVSIYRAVETADSYDARESYNLVETDIPGHLNVISGGLSYLPDGTRLQKASTLLLDPCDVQEGDIVVTSNGKWLKVDMADNADAHLLPYIKTLVSKQERLW